MGFRGSWFTRVGVGVGVVVALGLATGAVLGTASGSATGRITVDVPGALNISVHCEGDETFFADGEQIEFERDGALCDIEAPLSAVMPLRGRMEIGRSGSYVCARDDMDLVCTPK